MEQQQQQPESFDNSRFGMFTASEMHRLMASGARPKTEQELSVEKENKGREKKATTLFGEGAMTWIEEKVNECITGEKKKQFTDWNTEWGIAHKREALLFFEQVTGKEVQHFTNANYQFFPYNAVSGCSTDGLLVNESAVVQVKCPANSANHSPLLRIKTNNPPWLKAKIKGERQAWLKANRYEHYVQCQFEMMCTATRKCYYLSYDPRPIERYHRMAVIELLADAAMQQDIAKRIACATALLKTAIEQLSIPDAIYKNQNSKIQNDKFLIPNS